MAPERFYVYDLRTAKKMRKRLRRRVRYLNKLLASSESLSSDARRVCAEELEALKWTIGVLEAVQHKIAASRQTAEQKAAR